MCLSLFADLRLSLSVGTRTVFFYKKGTPLIIVWLRILLNPVSICRSKSVKKTSIFLLLRWDLVADVVKWESFKESLRC